MTAPIPVAVAPNFHLPDALADHLLLADGAGSSTMPQSATPDSLTTSVLLFVLPEHLRSALWGILEQGGEAEDFDNVASEVGRFLAFKQLPPPERAVLELVLNGSGGKVEPRGLWAVINLGDDPVVFGVPGLRVRLGAGEGARLPEALAAEVIPPEGDAPDVLLLVRRPARGPEA
jgi:hypothetical protein